MEKITPSFVIGMLLVVAGVFLAFITLDIIEVDVSTSWPLLVLVPGMLFLALSASGKEARVFVFPGVLLTFVGGFFLFDNLSLVPYGMTYMWPIFPTSVGFAFLASYLYAMPHRLILILSAVFIALGSIFFFVNFGVFSGITYRLWPIVLISIGLILLFGRRND
jgi:hypothetical protein